MYFHVTIGTFCIIVERKNVSVVVRCPGVVCSDQVASHPRTVMQCYFMFVEVKVLMQMEKGVSMNEPSKTRWSFLPSLHTRQCGVKNRSGKKHSSQHGKGATCFLCSSLFKAFSTFVRFLLTEA